MKFPKQVYLGKSGLKISPIVVGCMSYGSKKWADWVIEEKEEVFKLLKYCYDHGLRTFDTADVYSNGESEILLGEFLKQYKIDRETVVILSKVFCPVREGLLLSSRVSAVNEKIELDMCNQKGLSRKHILDGVSKSVARLGTYIDVLQIHRLDRETPMEEIMKALNDIVERGDALYIGASSMRATELAELQFIAEKHNWTKFISSQSCYNLLLREDEKEVIPFTQKHGIGLIPWSPNARGLLTRPHGVETGRSQTDNGLYSIGLDKLGESDIEIIQRVQQLSEQKKVSMAAIATAWVMSKGCNPILGLSSIERIDQALKALETQLTEEEKQFLEEPYQTKKLII
ncbi:LAMI_0A00100g1_1 [Lachancea mirantina]|uniref:LAMI_0A00100g1_1 n=1 Tax=Lachancea mirantina TaxID=1230905 RepID=A0A1G4IKZ7_9SACH|nr:LAMI_0A00100g1_1 [Lachancea mirantina]